MQLRESNHITETRLPAFPGAASAGPNVNNIKDAMNGSIEDSVLQFFQLFFSSTIMQSFLSATNYFGKTFVRGWRFDVTLAEFKAFLSIILLFGLIKYPDRRFAFKENPRNIKALMSMERFDNILRAWHFEDYSKHGQKTPQQRAEKRKNDPFWTVKLFVTIIATSFEKMFNPHQKVDLDEQSVAWKGRHICRCYNPKKPSKWHFKIFSLNDSLTGYQLGFYLYQGKSELRPNNSAATVGTIMVEWVVPILSISVYPIISLL
jgi:hypothetical protein